MHHVVCQLCLCCPCCFSLPGDYGWDPLGLADPSKRGQPGEDKFINLEWMAYAELIHGRWAPPGASVVCFMPRVTAQHSKICHRDSCGSTVHNSFSGRSAAGPDICSSPMPAIAIPNWYYDCVNID